MQKVLVPGHIDPSDSGPWSWPSDLVRTPSQAWILIGATSHIPSSLLSSILPSSPHSLNIHTFSLVLPVFSHHPIFYFTIFSSVLHLFPFPSLPFPTQVPLLPLFFTLFSSYPFSFLCPLPCCWSRSRGSLPHFVCSNRCCHWCVSIRMNGILGTLVI